ncbi:hypothetical protein [Caldanaerobius polysaccharolyticus]|uniref:hypothetical protein n=1 Tax=Caldanaerobius polysaccharolyticus TaxID=44256 RepID=UPI0012EBCD1B|nr:hypothetical protein [Caldanaerobius polysaccharolyticus]
MSIDFKEIINQVKENQNKLNSCIKHDFSIDITPEKKLDKRYRCINCNGEVSSIEKY